MAVTLNTFIKGCRAIGKDINVSKIDNIMADSRIYGGTVVEGFTKKGKHFMKMYNKEGELVFWERGKYLWDPKSKKLSASYDRVPEYAQTGKEVSHSPTGKDVVVRFNETSEQAARMRQNSLEDSFLRNPNEYNPLKNLEHEYPTHNYDPLGYDPLNPYGNPLETGLNNDPFGFGTGIPDPFGFNDPFSNPFGF